MNKTEAQLQDIVQQMFQQPQVATDENSFNSFNSLPDEVDLPKLMVTRTEVRVDQVLRTQIINSLAADVHYEDILLKLEEEGDNAEIPTEQGKYRVKDGMLVFHPRSPLVQDGPFWKMVVPDDNEIKKIILNELHSVPVVGPFFCLSGGPSICSWPSGSSEVGRRLPCVGPDHCRATRRCEAPGELCL